MLSYKDSIRAYIKFNFAVYKLKLSLQELFISGIITGKLSFRLILTKCINASNSTLNQVELPQIERLPCLSH